MGIRILSFFLLVTVCGISKLWASVVTPPTRTPAETLTILTEHNPLIVVGTVAEQTSHYGKDKRFPREDHIIVTDVRVDVEQVVKGEPALPAVRVQIPGGCVKGDKLCFHTDIAPEFQAGEKVLLFLSPAAGAPDASALAADAPGIWQIDDFLDGKQTLRDGRFYPLGLTLEEITQGVGP